MFARAHLDADVTRKRNAASDIAIVLKKAKHL